MKKVLFLFAVTAAFSFTTQDEKSYNIKMQAGEVDYTWNVLQSAETQIAKSNIPTAEGIKLLQGIDSVKRMLARQVQAQNKAATKK